MLDLDPFLVCNPETEEDMNSLISDFLSTLIIPVCRLLAEKRPCLHISKHFSDAVNVECYIEPYDRII